MGQNDFLLQIAPYVAEFFGTFTLVLTAEWCTLTGAEVGWCVTAVAAVLVALVYACAPISGSNFNPAISLSLALCGRLEWNVCFGYILTQVTAGVLAGCLCNILLWRAVAQGLKAMIFEAFPWHYAGGAELIFTCMLCFVNLNVTQKGWWFKDNHYFGLAIGLVIAAGGYAVGGISGACFNPAIILAFDLTLWDGSLKHTFLYSCWQLTGCVLAALLFKVIRPKGDEKDDLPLLSKICAEFIGTWFIAVTFCFNIITRSKALWWSTGSAVLAMSYALYGAAGCFNPALTTAALCAGKWNNHWLETWTPSNHVIAIFAQFCAGALAGFTVGLWCIPRSDAPHWIQVEVGKFATAVEYPLFTSLFCEFLFTKVVALVFLAVWSKDNHDVNTPSFYGLAIGFAVMAGGFAAGPVSGGILNPALAGATSAEGYVNTNYAYGHMDANWLSLFLYWTLAEFCGGAAGAGIYRVIYRGEYTDKEAPKPLMEPPKAGKNDRACGGCTGLPWRSDNLH